MATTNFVNGETTVVADWLNDVDAHVYELDHNAYLKKDGTVNPTANLPMGNNKHTGAAAASSANEYLVYGQSSAVIADITVTNATSAARFIPTAATVPVNGMYLPATNSIGISTASTERVRVNAAGLVGLGKTPGGGARLDILGTNNTSTFGANGDVIVYSNDQTKATQYGWNQLNSTDDFLIGRAGVAKLTVGSTELTTNGVKLVSSFDGNTSAAGSAGDLVLRRSSSVGAIYFGDSAGTNILSNSNNLTIGNTYALFAHGGDNLCTLGGASNRWTTVYATTGTINTSDADDKEDIQALTDAEKRVALKIKQSIRRYKFSDAVAAKGAANARIHIGTTAQAVRDAFVSEGLNPRRYGMFCLDTWYVLPSGEITNATTPGAIEKTRLGIRYEELLTFVIAAM